MRNCIISKQVSLFVCFVWEHSGEGAFKLDPPIFKDLEKR